MSSTYLITGANRGIGLEFCRQLIERGDSVIACAREPKSATDLQALVSASGDDIETHKLDVSVQADVDALKKALAGRDIDVLINNAGIMVEYMNTIESAGLDVVERTLDVNLLGPMRMVQAFLPQVLKSSSPRIINVSSKVGSIDDNHSGRAYAYRISKAALNMFNKSLSVELENGPAVAVVVHPGWVATDMGGANAPTSPEESAAGLLKVIDGLGQQDNGKFFDFRGDIIPW